MAGQKEEEEEVRVCKIFSRESREDKTTEASTHPSIYMNTYIYMYICMQV